jgi:hypothetical protein
VGCGERAELLDAAVAATEDHEHGQAELAAGSSMWI